MEEYTKKKEGKGKSGALLSTYVIFKDDFSNKYR